jgi:periplasmic divalent cation tolerance protein
VSVNFHHVSIYVTCASREEARNIVHTLLNEKLIACANITENVTSVYRWMGDIQSDTEASFIAKTSKAHVETVIERIKALHSYDCPCITAWPIVYGNVDYLDWMVIWPRPPKRRYQKSGLS